MKKGFLYILITLCCLFANFSIAADNPLTEKIGWVTKLEGPLTNGSGSELTEVIEKANNEGVSFVQFKSILQADALMLSESSSRLCSTRMYL